MVKADVCVERVEWDSSEGDPDHESAGDSSHGGRSTGALVRLVATSVIAASCQCQSGAGGGCHHVCQLLQLVRLLQLTERELLTWDPASPTSVACRWILNNCGGGRGSEDDVFRNKPLTLVAEEIRKLRDPKRVPLPGGGGA